jgi:hypothetical protein
MLFLLKLRLLILYRTLAHAGWFLMLFTLLLCSVPIINFGYTVIEKPEYWWGFVLLAPALLWHFNRKDRNFLKIAGIPIQAVLLTDYFLIGFLPICFLCLSKNWLGVLSLTVGTILLTFVPIPQKSMVIQSNYVLPWIPLDFFEWRTGFRKNFYVLILMYFITLANCVWIGGLLLSVLFLASFLVSFYDFIENKDLLQKTFSIHNAFYKKLQKHLLLTLVFITPHTLVYLFFNQEYWAIALACVCFLLAMVAFSMALKYEKWYVTRQRVVQGVPHGVFLASLISAIFTPFALGWLIWLCIKANQKMNLSFFDKYPSANKFP